MALTSLGAVSNSSSKAFTNAVGTIAVVNYGRVLGSVVPIPYNPHLVQSSKVNTKTVSKTVSKKECKKNKKHNKKHNKH